MPDVVIPDGLAWLIVAGAAAVALWNIAKVARAFRLDRLLAAFGRMVGRATKAAFSPLSAMVADAVEERVETRVRPVVDDAVVERLADQIEARIDARLMPVWSELRPNHGTSLRDGVDRIEVAVSTMRQELTAHLEDVEAHTTDPNAHRKPSNPDRGGAGPRA